MDEPVRWSCARARHVETKGDSMTRLGRPRTAPLALSPVSEHLPSRSTAAGSPSLIFSLKIRNRRNCPTIKNLHFSNLYALPALHFTTLQPRAEPRRTSIHDSEIKSSMRRASSSRASIASRGIPPPPTREPRAKLQRTLIYGNGINFPRKSLKTKDRHYA